MKKIINGKRYDTESAIKLARWWNLLSPSDFNHCYETLYRKKTGEYFLHGEGGPYSKYREVIDENNFGGGETIIPLTLEAAKEWAERHLDGDEYESIFGEIEENAGSDGPQQQYSLLIPTAVLDALKTKKDVTGTTVSALIIKALRDAGYGS